MACKKTEIEFSYSPSAPRAGQSVTFSNLCSAGEEWAWTFGDGATSTLKSPTHVYKKPGTYVVTLKVDDKNARKVAKEITIYDTIPSFGCADTVFYIYQDYTFAAQIYNPYNYEVDYLWNLAEYGDYIQLTDTAVGLTTNQLSLFFTQPHDAIPLSLRIVLSGDTTPITKTFAVLDRPTNSVLIRTADNDYRQRIFGQRAEQEKIDADATALLDAEQDTAQTYNGKAFTLSELSSTFSGIQGFHIANRKLYYRANGLWVANIDGSNRVQIDEADCPAMTLDLTDNRIYWANNQGVWFMSFVGSDNNKFVSTPEQLNTMTNVIKLAADGEPK